MNNVVLIGNLTRDPELSYTPNNQTAVCKFTLAVERPRRQGEDQGADFIRITVWGRQAETCDRYLSKGCKAAVRGHISTGSYKDRNGQTVYTTDVVADAVEFLTAAGGKNSAFEGRNTDNRPISRPQQNYTSQGEYEGFDSFQAAEDDMPF